MLVSVSFLEHALSYHRSHELLLAEGVFTELRGDSPIEHDYDSVRDVGQLKDVARIEEEAVAFVGERLQHFENLGLRADINASCQVVEEQEPSSGEEELPDNDLLLVAARQAHDRLLRVSVADLQVPHDRFDARAFLSSPQNA